MNMAGADRAVYIWPNVRFSPKATELPRGSELTRCGNSGFSPNAGKQLYRSHSDLVMTHRVLLQIME
jgi:hypothetical protein